MRNTVRFLAHAILFAPLVLAQSKKIEVTDLPNHPFEVRFPPAAGSKCICVPGTSALPVARTTKSLSAWTPKTQ